VTNEAVALLHAARKAKRHEHRWGERRFVSRNEPGLMVEGIVPACVICGIALHDFEARQRRGRTALRAGKDAERAITKRYPGAKRTGMYGGPDDVLVGDLFVVQSKAGGWFSVRYWNELVKLPRTGGRIPTLIVSERPKPGVHARRLVIRLLEDDVALHGEKP